MRCSHRPLKGLMAWCQQKGFLSSPMPSKEIRCWKPARVCLPERVIGEPVGRDTAAAVGLAALLVEKEDKDAAFALLPADHVIEDGAGFRSVLSSAFDAAEADDLLVTVGIKPSFPATGYGYLCSAGKRLVESRAVRFQKCNDLWRNQILKPPRIMLQMVIIFGMPGCLSGDRVLFFLK